MKQVYEVRWQVRVRDVDRLDRGGVIQVFGIRVLESHSLWTLCLG